MFDNTKRMITDKNGNVNNLYEFGTKAIPPMPNLTNQYEIAYPNIRVPRAILNHAHSFCAANDAEIYMHS